EMRNPPIAVGAVAVKAAAEMVANSAHFHLFKCRDRHALRVGVLVALASINQIEEVARLGEFGAIVAQLAVAEASPFFVELVGDLIWPPLVESSVGGGQDGGVALKLRFRVLDDRLA